jgi:hypothetical protein
MGSKLWAASTVEEEHAIAVYRPGLILPLAILTFVTVLSWITISGSIQDYTFFLIFWSVFAVPIALRRRSAAIFTQDAFIFRPIFGQPLKVHFAGIKRVQLVPETGDEYPVPTVCIEFIVGGQILVGLNVKGSDEVIRRLQEAASGTT